MFRWNKLNIPRLYGLDLKNNIIDVKDGESLDCENVFQNGIGVVSKRRGNSAIFDYDTETKVQEIGTATISGIKYYFRFSAGDFYYSTSINGVSTVLSPSPAIDATNNIWWEVISNKLYFVDGTNVLRYFDGSAIRVSSVYARPTVAPSGAVGAGFDYGYTVDNGLAESPFVSNTFNNVNSASNLTVAGNTGPQTLVVGDKIRMYSKTTSTVAQWRNVTSGVSADANLTAGADQFGNYFQVATVAGSYTVATVALSEAQPILYTDLGLAPNFSAVTGLQGITVHYGRLIGWKDSNVYVAKVSNSDSWPADTAAREAFNYGFFQQDGETITACKSFQESLYVFKDTKIAAFGGIGPDDTGGNGFTFRRLETNGIGCVAGKTIQSSGDQDGATNYLIWLSRDGFYASTGDKPIRVGEKIEGQVFSVSLSNLRKSVSFYHKRDGFYHCYVGTDSTKTGWVLDLTKDEGTVVGWFKMSGINPTCIYWDEDKYIFGTNTGYSARERNSGTSLDFSDIFGEYVASTAIDTATDEITVTKVYTTGEEVIFRTGGTVPNPLVNNTLYYAIYVSDTEIRLATSEANALAGTAINLTTQGTGNHSLVSKKAISAYYTTNWIKFKDASIVKKLGKPMLLFNAAATEISLKMEMAVDWFDSFFDPHTITITSSDSWGLLPWGSFVWGAGSVATPKNVAIARRKCRSIRYRFTNEVLNQDFNLKGFEQQYAYIRNRGEFSTE
jgi:hypothetical protein